MRRTCLFHLASNVVTREALPWRWNGKFKMLSLFPFFFKQKYLFQSFFIHSSSIPQQHNGNRCLRNGPCCPKAGALCSARREDPASASLAREGHRAKAGTSESPLDAT